MLDLVELKVVCDEYDRVWGQDPGSRFEGEAIYDFAVECAAKAEKAKPEQPTTALCCNG